MMVDMTPRERVIAALNHREPDRVPFSCKFTYDAYRKVAEYIGFERDGSVKPGSPWLSVGPTVAFLRELSIDLIFVGLGKGQDTPPFQYGMERYTDEWGVTFRKVKDQDAIHYEFVDHPVADATVEDLEDYPWPDPQDPARVEGLTEMCRRLYHETDLALVGRFNNSIWEQAFYLRGFQRLLLDMAMNPEFPCALMDKLTDIAVSRVEVGMAHCGKYLQVLRLAGDDMGHQYGTLLSPKMFRELVKPRFARLYETARQMLDKHNPEAKLMAHTCGDVYPIIPDYIEMGLEVLDPVQPYVAEMERAKLKREFGDRLSFYGGIDIQKVMPYGTPADVKAEVRKAIEALGPGGGYVVAPAHYLQADVPPENVIALRDGVLEYGRYPLT